MHRLLLFLILQKVALADDLPPVSAYVGTSVTLPSGADASWELSSITWSIWTNTTGIATYFGNTINLKHIPKYRGRLQLNQTTGDLTITNVSSGDEMEYTVDFFNNKGENKFNKIKLNIKQRLSKPTVIRTRLSPGFASCLFGFRCSSLDSGVTLSWQTDPDFQNSYGEINNEVIVILNKTQSPVKFTCFSKKNGDSANTTKTLSCADTPVATCPPLVPFDTESKIISRDPVHFLVGFLVGAFVAVFVICCVYHIRQRRKSGSKNISQRSI